MITVSVERLREVFRYEPETGELFWRIANRGARDRSSAGSRAGGLASHGYYRLTVDRVTFYAHRAAWALMTGAWPEGQLDHINGDRSDNRWQNLREATGSQNNANKGLGVKNTSGFKGVSWSRTTRRWQAQLATGGKNRPLGMYDTPEEAHEAYKRAAIEAFGEYARVA